MPSKNAKLPIHLSHAKTTKIQISLSTTHQYKVELRKLVDFNPDLGKITIGCIRIKKQVKIECAFSQLINTLGVGFDVFLPK